MSLVVLAALKFIALHTLEGFVVMINPQQVTTLTARRSTSPKLVHHDVRCVIGLADGRFVSVVETCETVNKLMEGP